MIIVATAVGEGFPGLIPGLREDEVRRPTQPSGCWWTAASTPCRLACSRAVDRHRPTASSLAWYVVGTSRSIGFAHGATFTGKLVVAAVIAALIFGPINLVATSVIPGHVILQRRTRQTIDTTGGLPILILRL
jgi:hypothetical protein